MKYNLTRKNIIDYIKNSIEPIDDSNNSTIGSDQLFAEILNNLPCDYTNQIKALLLLENFTSYKQEIINVNNTHNEYDFILNNDTNIGFLIKIIIDAEVFDILRIETFFDLKMTKKYNINNSKFDFYKRLSNVFPLDYNMQIIKTDVLDLKGKKITIHISNPLIILERKFNTLNRLFRDKYMPSQILDITSILLSTFSNHDFEYLKYDYLTDHIPEKFTPDVNDDEVKFYFKGIKEITKHGEKIVVHELKIDLRSNRQELNIFTEEFIAFPMF